VADSTILREYLIALGFKVDEDQYRKIQNTISKTAEVLGGIGAATAVAAALVDKYVVQMAGKFDDLYYAAQQSRTSIANLQDYSYAARMVGLDGNAAAAGIANMARALRENPMLNGRLQQLGGKPGGDTAENQTAVLKRLAQMGPDGSIGRAYALKFASQLGMDSDTTNQLLNNLPAYLAAQAEAKAAYAKAGINQADVGENSKAFSREMDRLGLDIDILKTTLLIHFLPTIDKLVTGLTAVASWLSVHPDLTVAGGATAFVGSVGAAGAGGFFTLKKLLQFAGKSSAKVGGGELAVGGEALGAEGAIEGGAGLGIAGLATTILPVVLAILALLGIGAVVYELIKHRKEEGEFSDKARDYINGKIKQGKDKIKQGKDAVVGEAAWEGHAFAAMPGDLAAAIRRSEGLRLHRYMDQGKATIGYGHHLLPGEKYSTIDKATAEKLLQSDLLKTDGVIDNLLPGVKLSAGMRDALRDYHFNSGGLGNAHKLLSDLRAGRTDKAASDFALYGGYHDVNGVFHPGGSDAMSKGLLNRRLGDAAMARGVSITQKTDIHVTGTNDPHTVARHTLNGQKRTNSDLARNVAAASGAW
jgi:GH24 family phage-related lysozyme (muramidase)